MKTVKHLAIHVDSVLALPWTPVLTDGGRIAELFDKTNCQRLKILPILSMPAVSQIFVITSVEVPAGLVASNDASPLSA